MAGQPGDICELRKAYSRVIALGSVPDVSALAAIALG
jgi:hypothetical protein